MLALGREMADALPRRRGCSTTRTRWRCSAGSSMRGRRRRSRGSVPLGPVHRRATSPSSSACPPRRSPSSPPASTTRRSSSASSMTGDDLYPATRRADRRRPGASSGASVSPSTGASASSRPSRASTLAEYVPWFMRHDDELERYRIPVDEYIRRSEENLVEFERVKAAARPRRADAASSARTSTRRRSSTRWRRASRSVIYGNVAQRRAAPGPAGRLLRRGAVPRRRHRPASRRGARLPAQLAALNRTYLERRRADRACGARGPARLRPRTPRCSIRTPGRR